MTAPVVVIRGKPYTATSVHKLPAPRTRCQPHSRAKAKPPALVIIMQEPEP